MARGILRIFLGAAPGVGKTYSMLEEGHVQAAAGVDVVAGIVRDHGREQTRAQLEGLEQLPTKTVGYRGSDFEELDVAALLARRPALALVDEYAHSNVPGAGNAKRWQDVEELLAAGIDVYSTVNVQHLASLADVVEAITGVRQQETVPDDVVRRAEQIELVDIPPELLRQRLSAGNVYARDLVDAAMANYFRLGNLTALRELALLWLADRVEEGVAKYRESHGIEASWPTRERVVVGLSGGAEGEFLLRRAARILSRVSGGELMAVHIPRSDGVAGSVPLALEGQRQLVTDLGGSYHSVGGEDTARALLDFARSVGATQIVIGTSRRKPLLGVLASPGVGARVVRDAGDIDVHMVPHPLGGKSGLRFSRGDLNRGRVIVGFALAALLPVLVQLGTGELSLQLTMLIQSAHHSGGPGGRTVAGRGGRSVEQPTAELLLRAAPRYPDHQRPGEPAGAARVPHCGRGRGARRGPVRQAVPGGQQGQRRGRHPQRAGAGHPRLTGHCPGIFGAGARTLWHAIRGLVLRSGRRPGAQGRRSGR